jgi:hypothetical protein
MKLNKIFAAFMLIAAVAFAACQPVNPPGEDGPGNGGNNGGNTDKDSTVVTPPTDNATPDTIGWNIPAEAITASEARALCEALPADQATGTKYYVMGYIKKLHSENANGIAKYGNASFYMEDVKGADSKDDFVAFQVMGLDGKKITDPAAVAEGDFVVVYGELVNFKGNTPETVNKGAAYIWKSTNPVMNGGNTPGDDNTGNGDVEVGGQGTYESPYTVADVIALGNSTKEVSGGKFYVKGYIVGQIGGMNISSLEFAEPWTTQSGKTYQTNIVIAATVSETSADKVVPVQLPSGALRTGLNLPENPTMLGKEVLLYGSLEGYFSVAGVKGATYAEADGKVFGTKPVESTGEEILNETLGTQASFGKFTEVSVKGDQVWTFDSQYSCVKMSGYADGATVANEDWFISPAMDLTGKSNVNVSFTHAFGPKTSVPTTEETKAQYTVWVSNDFNGDVTTATWTELTGMVYGTDGWAWVNSGNLAIPAENLKANCRIAWKYVCESVSATWEIKEVIVK